MLVIQSCPTLCDPTDCSPQAFLSMGFFRQEYWSGLPFPSPRDLPNPGIQARSLALQADSLSTEPLGKWEGGAPLIQGGRNSCALDPFVPHTIYFIWLFICILYSILHNKWVNISKCSLEFCEPF